MLTDYQLKKFSLINDEINKKAKEIAKIIKKYKILPGYFSKIEINFDNLSIFSISIFFETFYCDERDYEFLDIPISLFLSPIGKIDEFYKIQEEKKKEELDI